MEARLFQTTLEAFPGGKKKKTKMESDWRTLEVLK